MKAMILAGGMSTRLYPLTRQVPKPLVPIAGEPISAHVLRYLASYGITEVAINIHYLADAIREAFGDGSHYGVKLHYLHEAKLMGSAGGLKQMEAFLHDEPFVVVGCDDLTDLDLSQLIAFHTERKALATIALYEADEVDQYGVVITDASSRIVDFQEKPAKGTERSHLVNTGIYAFDPAIFARIPAGEFYDFGKNVFPDLQRTQAAFYGLLMRGGYWADIGTPGEYRRASADALAGRVRLHGTNATGVDPSARLGRDVSIEGDVRIGAATEIGANVRIVGPTVIGDRCTIGRDARVTRSILWNGARVGAGADLENVIAGIDYEIAAGAVLADDIVANEPIPS